MIKPRLDLKKILKKQLLKQRFLYICKKKLQITLKPYLLLKPMRRKCTLHNLRPLTISQMH